MWPSIPFPPPLLPSIPPASQSSNQSAHSNYFSPTQGKLLPYRPAVLLRHSWDKFSTTLLFLLLRGIGISMSIKADRVLYLFSHPPCYDLISGHTLQLGMGRAHRLQRWITDKGIEPCVWHQRLRDDEVMQMCSLWHSSIIWPFGSAGTSGLRGERFVKLHFAVQVAGVLLYAVFALIENSVLKSSPCCQ